VQNNTTDKPQIARRAPARGPEQAQAAQAPAHGNTTGETETEPTTCAKSSRAT